MQVARLVSQILVSPPYTTNFWELRSLRRLLAETFGFQVPEGEGSRSVICSEETDVYSYGSIILQVLSGHVPFSDSNVWQVNAKVALGHRPPRGIGWDSQPIPDVYWRFIERCWDRVPRKRPSSFDVLEFTRSQLTQPK